MSSDALITIAIFVVLFAGCCLAVLMAHIVRDHAYSRQFATPRPVPRRNRISAR